MITPVFRVEQNAESLIITIRAPYTNIKDTEIVYEDRTFLFASKPYFLRLFLPAAVVDDESGTADYDFDRGSFTIKVPKLNKNEHFDNLEMLSELLRAPKSDEKALSAQPLVQEISNSGRGGEEQAGDNINGIEDDELYAKQNVPYSENEGENLLCDEICEKFGYGFAWKRHDVLGRFSEEISDLFDIGEPETSVIGERAQKCFELDKTKFNPSYYLADLFDPEDGLREALNFNLEPQKYLTMNDLDREQLKNLRIRTSSSGIPEEINRKISYGLIDILGAYSYDLRTTDGEHCVESGWTLAKLAPTLTYLVRWDTPKMALIGLLRRILCYPLYRNWDLAKKVLEDLEIVLKGERVTILKCLLDIRRIFNKSGECRYLYNQLFIDDLCLWIQSVDLGILQNLLIDFQADSKSLSKDWLNLDLEFLETEAKLGTLKLDENGKMAAELDSDDDSDPESWKSL